MIDRDWSRVWVLAGWSRGKPRLFWNGKRWVSKGNIKLSATQDAAMKIADRHVNELLRSRKVNAVQALTLEELLEYRPDLFRKG